MCITWLKMIQEATVRLEKSVETQNGLAPLPQAAAKCLPEKGCLSTPCWAPQPREPELGRGLWKLAESLFTREKWESSLDPGGLLKR